MGENVMWKKHVFSIECFNLSTIIESPWHFSKPTQ